jgi:hypothetical protein
MLQTEIQKIIDEKRGEREIASFLSKNPNIIRWAVCKTGGHSTYVIKEFPLGSNYKVDFIVPMSYSGVWEINLIELEPHDDMVITKDGLPSNRLNKAISQIHDWKEYIEKNPLQFRNDLSKWCMKKDLLGYFNDKEAPCNNTGHFLNSPDTFIRYRYYIIIGNRGIINNEKRRKVNQISTDIEIFTYGRLVDIAANCDKSSENPLQSVNIRESEE